MKLTTLIKIVMAVFIALALAATGSLLFLRNSYVNQADSLARQAEFKQLGLDLAAASDYLTQEAELYAILGDRSHYNNYWLEVNETQTREKIIERLLDLGIPPEEMQLIEAAKQESDKLIPLEEASFAAVEVGDRDLAINIMFGQEYRSGKTKINSAITAFQQQMNNRLAEEVGEASRLFNNALILTGALVAAMILGVLIILGMLYRRIAATLPRLASLMTALADGDLTVEELEINTKDEMGEMAAAFNGMLKEFRVVIARIRRSSDVINIASQELSGAARQTTDATNQIAAAIQQVATEAGEQTKNTEGTVTSVQQLGEAIRQIAKGAQDQAQHVEETANILHENATHIEQVATVAHEVDDAADKTLTVAQSGGETIQSMLASMEQIASSANEVAASIEELGRHSQQIGEIVELIDGIAEQTNLLALNAAIEAARAGEHGQGFAVVAGEVRKLAEGSQQATRDIRAIVNNMQEYVEKAVEVTHVSLNEVETGTGLAGNAGEALREILMAMEETRGKAKDIVQISDLVKAASETAVAAIDNIAGITQENTAATEEMAAASDEVEQSIQQVAAISEETAASAEEVSASVEEVTASVEQVSNSARSLHEMAEALNELVARFKLEQTFTDFGMDPSPRSEQVADSTPMAAAVN